MKKIFLTASRDFLGINWRKLDFRRFADGWTCSLVVIAVVLIEMVVICVYCFDGTWIEGEGGGCDCPRMGQGAYWDWGEWESGWDGEGRGDQGPLSFLVREVGQSKEKRLDWERGHSTEVEIGRILTAATGSLRRGIRMAKSRCGT